jgi:hypothetical protein
VSEDRKFMTSLTRAEINEIERRKQDENDARIRQLYGVAGTTKHPRLS